MELPGLELSGPGTSTPYAEVRSGCRLADDAEAARVDDERRRQRLLDELRRSAAPGAPGPSPTS